MRWTWTYALIGGLLVATPAHAQVDCSDPDNLCTGDPCVIGNVTVDAPCIVDFGARTLVIAEKLTCDFCDVLSLTAASIDVPGILASRGDIILSTASVTLTATNDITISGTPGLVAANDITLDAGGNIELAASAFRLGYAVLDVHAGGTLSVASNVLARDANDVSLSGDAGVTIDGVVSVRGYGNDPGAIYVTSSDGSVVLNGDLKVGPALEVGPIVVTAADDITVNGTLRARTSSERFGLSPIANDIQLTSTEGNVTVNGRVRMNAQVVRDFVVNASGTATLRGPVVAADTEVNAASIDVGDGVRIVSNRHKFKVGSMRFTAASGDLYLGGRYIARSPADPSTIEGHASGNTTARGSFLVAPGCLAFSAGGTLDTAGARFDVTPVADCPGSASGAFLEPLQARDLW